MIEGWTTNKLRDILELVYGKSLSKNNRQDGNIPVYGSNGIVGYHNEAFVNEQGIIVGRKGSAGNVTFSKIPFCPIDTTFYITQANSKLDLEFLYYALMKLDLKRILGDVGVPGLNREMAYLEELTYPKDINEQRKIAYVLSTVQKAIEQQDKLIRTTTELKKALMQKLFTEGTKGEKLKQTEIGWVPESWEVVELGKYAFIENGFAFKSTDYVKNGIPLIRISNVSHGFFIENDNKYLPESFLQTYSRFALKNGDLIISLTRPVTSGGLKYCFVEEKDLPALLNQRVGRFQIRDTNHLSKDFLFHLVFSNYFVGELFKLFGSSSQQPNVSPSQLESFKVPIPKIEEQNEIARILFLLFNKTRKAEEKKQTLTNLFKTLLHELMAGQRRVNEIDFETECHKAQNKNEEMLLAAEPNIKYKK
jgi:type I restriction enzyme S subunit